MTNEECVRQYSAASAAHDLDALDRMRHADWRVDWPQSGERVESSEHFASVMRNHPGGPPRSRVTRIVGAEDRWVVTPGNTVLPATSGRANGCSTTRTAPRTTSST